MLHHRSQLLFLFCLPLLVLVSARQSVAREHDSIPLFTSIQPWPDSLQPENFRTSLLGYSLNSYDLLISRFVQPVVAARCSEDLPLYLPAFGNLLGLHSNNVVLDTARAASRLNVTLGSKREQILFLDHRQRLSKAITWDLSYNSVVSEGFLIHQFSKYKGFNSGFKVRTARYQLDAGYIFHKVEAEENGGILPGQVTKNLSKSDYALLSVYLNDAASKVRKSDVFLNQSLKLASLSESTALKLVTNSSFTRIRRSYTDTPDTGFFAHNYLDTAATKDTLQLRAWRNAIGIQLSTTADSSRIHEWILEAGISNAVDQYLTDSVSLEHTNWMPYVKAALSMRMFEMEGSVKTSTSQEEGKNDALFADVSATARLNSTYLTAVHLNLHATSLAPEYNIRRLVSNHFAWENDDLKNEQATSVEGALSFFHNVLEVYGKYEVKKHSIVFDADALPVELSRENAVSVAGIRLDVHLRHWAFFADAATLHSSLAEVPVPDTRLYGRLSYKSTFFKSALKAEFGASCTYTAAYKALAYQPATGVYFFQSSWTVAGQPNASLFVNLGIGKAILSVQMENLMQGMSGNDNYAGPGYPVPPRTLKFGLKWWLVN